MEFHGIRGPKKIVPWNAMEFLNFHGTWLHHQFHGTHWNLHTQVTNFMEFHGTTKVSRNLVRNEIPWNSIEYSVVFH